MKLTDTPQYVFSVLIGLQLLGDASTQIPPFIRQAMQPSLDVHPGSPGLSLKFPTRDSDLFRLKPRRKHLKTHKLRRRLSKEFDADYMSVERPREENEIIVHKPDDILVGEVQKVNVTLTDSNGMNVNLSEPQFLALKSWLVQKGSCPVHYRWEDLGVFFWPRWLKRGYCVGEPSCSWPPGMHCIPSELKTLRLLYWKCRLGLSRNIRGRSRRPGKVKDTGEDPNITERLTRPVRTKRGKLGKRCRWIKVPYPVTDKCYCTC